VRRPRKCTSTPRAPDRKRRPVQRPGRHHTDVTKHGRSLASGSLDAPSRREGSEPALDLGYRDSSARRSRSDRGPETRRQCSNAALKVVPPLRPGGSAARRERVSRAPLLPQRGDQGGMPVLTVEHLAFGYPRRHDDGRDPVARAVEPEPVLADGGGRVRWRNGDLHPSNLIDRGRVSAVIDFAPVAVGDLACDLMVAWAFLDLSGREVFRSFRTLRPSPGGR
jgi:hypothetical protein